MSLAQCHKAFEFCGHDLNLSQWDLIFYRMLKVLFLVKEIPDSSPWRPREGISVVEIFHMPLKAQEEEAIYH